MKIRTGFVSNSSSSSFCIFGICLDEEKIVEKLKEKGHMPQDEESFYDWAYEAHFYGEPTPEKIEKVKDHLFYKEGLEMHQIDDYTSYTYIGAAWKNIKDDETGKGFQNRITNILRDLLDDPELKVSTCEVAWRDG